MTALDQCYGQKAQEENAKTKRNREERLLCYQQELEAQYKHQLETELSLYKSRELARVRNEERDRYQKELAAERLEATVAHQKQVQELRNMEQQMLERYRKKEQVSCYYSIMTPLLVHCAIFQDLEAGIYAQRQSLLTQLSALKVQEAEMQRQSEANKRTAQLEENRLRKLDQQLTGREKALENIKTHYESISEQKAKK